MAFGKIGQTLSSLEIYDLVRADLEKVEKEIGLESVASIEAVNYINQYLQTGGGKRLRPILVLLSGRLFGETTVGPLGRGVDKLCQLANEADVFASLLPDLGWIEAEALAREWQNSPRGTVVATFAGRLQLLRAYSRFSPTATRIGLASLCARQIDCFVVAAQAGSTPEQGAAALDTMPRAQARMAYRMTLAEAVVR